MQTYKHCACDVFLKHRIEMNHEWLVNIIIGYPCVLMWVFIFETCKHRLTRVLICMSICQTCIKLSVSFNLLDKYLLILIRVFICLIYKHTHVYLLLFICWTYTCISIAYSCKLMWVSVSHTIKQFGYSLF